MIAISSLTCLALVDVSSSVRKRRDRRRYFSIAYFYSAISRDKTSRLIDYIYIYFLTLRALFSDETKSAGRENKRHWKEISAEKKC